MYYNKQGEKISQEDYAKLFENREYKIVKQEELPNGKWVSTVWLGLNLRHDAEKPPWIFETMVFKSKDNLDDELCIRYSSINEAEMGHRVIVRVFNQI